MAKKFQRVVDIPDDEIVTPEDVNQAISAVVDAFRKVDTQIVGKIDATEQSLREGTQRVDQKVEAIDKIFSAKTANLARSINEMELKHGKDGKDADEKRIVKEVLAQIPVPADGKDGSQDSAEDIRNKLELLDGEDRLDKKAIRGLEDYDSVLEFSKRPIAPQILSGASGIKEIRAGSGVTIDNTVLGYPTISATGSGSGTVTDVSIVSANGLAGTVATSTTTPAITLSTTVNGLVKGNGTALSAAVANTDYQVPITLTTTGSSGAATFDGTTLNIPQYSGGGGSGDVVGPASATDGAPALFDGTTGKLLKNSTPTGTGNPVLQTAPTFATSITGSYLTASEILITDGSKNIVSAPVATYPSLTELTYVKGVTSAIQTQIDTKEAALTFSTGLTRTVNTITANISTGIAGSQTIYGGTAANEDLTIEGTSHATKTSSYVILQPSGGNVGIGTTTPLSKLSIVHGSSYVSANAALSLISSSDPNRSMYAGYDNSLNAGFIQAIEQNVAFRPLLLNPNGGNVGIGTTTPTSPLSVSGTLGSTPIVYIGSPGTSQALSMGTWYGGATSNSWIEASPLVLNPSGGGNVGIGTVSPNYTLHIETLGNGSTIGTGNWDDAVNLFVGSGYNGGVAYNTGNQIAAISSWTGEAGLTLMVNNVYGWLQAVDSSGNFQLRRGFAGQGGTAISVNTAGNVGFANTSPSALLTLGTAGTKAGTLSLAGGTSGVITLQTAAAAGTYTLTLPTTDGNASEFLQTDGSGVLTWAVPTGTGANTALSNLASVAINTTLVSDTDNTDDIGTSSVFWRTGYFKTSIELGATDTTIARSAAGVIAVEGVDVVNTTTAQTVTNKRNQPRTASSTSNANLDPDLATANVYYRTTQTVGLTIGAPTGTPVIGETIAIYVDSAGAQTLTFNATYIPFGAAFPASTTAGKTLMMTAQYNGTNWKTLWANQV